MTSLWEGLTSRRQQVATVGFAVFGVLLRAAADRTAVVSDLAIGIINIVRLTPYVDELWLLGIGSQFAMFAIVFYLFAPRAFPREARPITERTSFRLLVVAVALCAVVVVPHRVIATTLSPLSSSDHTVVWTLGVLYVGVAATGLFAVYAGWCNGWKSVTVTDPIVAVGLYRGEPGFHRWAADESLFGWLVDVAWYLYVGFAIGIRCIVFGTVAGLLVLFEPLPEVLVVTGVVGSFLRDRFPRRVDRLVPRIRDPEEYLYASVAIVGRGAKATLATVFAYLGIAVAAVSLIGPVPIATRELGPWPRTGIVVCTSIAVLYCLWFWVRVLVRLPRFVRWWDPSPDRGHPPELTIPGTVTRPPGLLLPAAVPLVVVAQFVRGGIDASTFELVWPMAVVVALGSVAITRWHPAQPAASDEYAIPVALGVYVAAVDLLYGGGAVTIHRVVLPDPNALVPIVGFPLLVAAVDLQGAADARPSDADGRGGWYAALVDGGYFYLGVTVVGTLGFVLLGLYAAAVTGSGDPYYAVAVAIGLVGSIVHAFWERSGRWETFEGGLVAAWLSTVLLLAVGLLGPRFAADVLLAGVILSVASVVWTDPGELPERPSGPDEYGTLELALVASTIVAVAGWLLVNLLYARYSTVTLGVTLLGIGALASTLRGPIPLAVPIYAWLLAPALTAAAVAGIEGVASAELLEHAAAVWVVGSFGSLWVLVDRRIACGYRTVALGVTSLSIVLGGAATFPFEPSAVADSLSTFDAVASFGWIGCLLGVWAFARSRSDLPLAAVLGALAGLYGVAGAMAIVVRPAAGLGTLAGVGLLVATIVWRRRIDVPAIEPLDADDGVRMAATVTANGSIDPETKRRLRILVTLVASVIGVVIVATLALFVYPAFERIGTDVPFVVDPPAREPPHLKYDFIPRSIPGYFVLVPYFTAVLAVMVYSHGIAVRPGSRLRFVPGVVWIALGVGVIDPGPSPTALLFGCWLVAKATTVGATGRLRYSLAAFYVLLGAALAGAAIATAARGFAAPSVLSIVLLVYVLLVLAGFVSLLGVAAAATQQLGKPVTVFETWYLRVFERWLY